MENKQAQRQACNKNYTNTRLIGCHYLQGLLQWPNEASAAITSTKLAYSCRTTVTLSQLASNKLLIHCQSNGDKNYRTIMIRTKQSLAANTNTLTEDTLNQ